MSVVENIFEEFVGYDHITEKKISFEEFVRYDHITEKWQSQSYFFT